MCVCVFVPSLLSHILSPRLDAMLLIVYLIYKCVSNLYYGDQMLHGPLTGLGSLLLKNLRFRDLESRQVQPLAWLLSLHKPKQTQAAFGNNRNKVNEIARGVYKFRDFGL